MHITCKIVLFCNDASPKQAENQLKGKISHRSLLDWFKYCRDICTRHILNNFPQLKRVGTTVEVDETRIGHIRKAYHGYNRNQDGVDEFGMMDWSTSTCFCAIVPHKSHACILPYIHRHVERGTTIHSDEARVYQILPRLGDTHKTVCHEYNFVNPFDGIHINRIEGLWSHVKIKWRSMHSVNATKRGAHLDKWMWKWNYHHSPSMFMTFIQHMALQYNF